MTRQELAAHRAAREFRCPEPQVVTVPRPDISDDIVDVRACGQVARYDCFRAKHGNHCVREPIDTKDIDALMPLPANLPPTATPTESLRHLCPMGFGSVATGPISMRAEIALRPFTEITIS